MTMTPRTGSGQSRDRRSLPLQVRDWIRAMIEEQGLRPGNQLPSEAELAVRFGVARTTAREALKLLEQDGMVDVRHGLGRYVSQLSALERPVTRLESVTEMMAARGFEVTTRVLSVSEQPASEEEARALEETPGTMIIRLERARLHVTDPLIYSTDVFRRSAIEGELDDIDWAGSLLALLERGGTRIVSSAAQMQAARLPEPGRRAMGVGLADPEGPWVLMVQRHLDEGGRTVLYSHDYYRGDRFTFNVIRRRFD